MKSLSPETPISAVAVDFDDTLSMTENACFELENAALAQLGHDPQSREVHRRTWGKPLEEAIITRSPGVDVDDFMGVIAELHPQFIKDLKIDVVSEENLRVLDQIAQSGLALFIVTSRTEMEVRHLLDPQHHVGGRFAKVYHHGNTPARKPDPQVFAPLFAENNLDPAACVYVGDSPTDGIAARKAGMDFIASLEAGLRTPEDFRPGDVDVFINHFRELPGAIKNLR